MHDGDEKVIGCVQIAGAYILVEKPCVVGTDCFEIQSTGGDGKVAFRAWRLIEKVRCIVDIGDRVSGDEKKISGTKKPEVHDR